jgi:hypothetical protein
VTYHCVDDDCNLIALELTVAGDWFASIGAVEAV